MAELRKGHHEARWEVQWEQSWGPGEIPTWQDPQVWSLTSYGLGEGQGTVFLLVVFSNSSPDLAHQFSMKHRQDPAEILTKVSERLLLHIKDLKPTLVTRSKRISDISRPPHLQAFQSDPPSTFHQVITMLYRRETEAQSRSLTCPRW